MADAPIVVNQAYDLTRWLLERIEKFPKSRKFTLGDRLARASLDMMESLVLASYSSNAVPHLDKANAQVQRLQILVRLAADLRCLALGQQEFCAKQLLEIGRQIGGWRRSLAKKEASGGLRAQKTS